MKCACGGNLKRITDSKYECEKCGLYSAVAFMELPKLELNIPTPINAIPINFNTESNIDEDLIKKLQDKIMNSLGVSSEFLERR